MYRLNGEATRFALLAVTGLVILAVVSFPAFGGVVGEKRIADPEFAQPREKRQRAGKQRAALVNGAVHIERDVRDLAEALESAGGSGR